MHNYCKIAVTSKAVMGCVSETSGEKTITSKTALVSTSIS